VIGIPEEEWTKGQREFVGSEFETADGGVLTVIGVDNGQRAKGWWNQKYIIKCSICSEDEKLWPYGSIKTGKSFLEKGTVPCGCTRTPRWSKEQYEVRINRWCSDRGYEFLGFNGEWRGKDTKVKIRDLETNEEWDSGTLHRLLFQGSGNPLKAKRRQLTGIHSRKYYDNDEDLISKSAYPEGTTFKLIEGKVWEVTCSVCSKDFYSHKDKGAFMASRDSILGGSLSCRCSKRYFWNQEEREFQMKHLLSEDNGQFLHWKDENGYENAHSKFIWKCHRGHVTESMVNTITSGSRCRYCMKEDMKERGWANGYMPDRKQEMDFLYILNFDNLYGKIGRSFKVNSRIEKGNGLASLSGIDKDKIKTLYKFTGTHEEVYCVEQRVIDRLREEGLTEENYTWNRELFLNGYEDYVRECVLEVGILQEVEF
jgi:hypothetical protein